MFLRPDHISEETWNALSDHQKLVEHEAHELLAGQHREFLCHDTALVRDCLSRGVMSESEILNYPHPEQWAVEQCEEWCGKQGIDFRSTCQEYDHDLLMLWLSDVIEYGDAEISDEILRRILIRRLDDRGNQGLTLWRKIVQVNAPDIYEWWSIEGSLADDLAEMGRFVLKNQYGSWWGRECTGMEILMDGTLQAVVRKRLSAQDVDEGGFAQRKRSAISNTRSLNELPDCWGRPLPDMQSRLFARPIEDVLRTLQVSRDDVHRWRQAGWVSFDIESQLEIDEPLILEIEFAAMIARSGLSIAQINRLLKGLPRPFRFQPHKVAYHLTYGWVVPVQEAPFEVVERSIDDWLRDLFESNDDTRLLELSEKIAGYRAMLEENRDDEAEETEVAGEDRP